MISSKHKRCRALGEKICLTKKCPLTRRPYAPGVHGPGKKNVKLSTYAVQLREKQKARFHYGLMERQFRNLFEHAHNQAGDTGVNMVQALEMRLDNVVYRLGYADTRAQARQLVRHGFIDLNDRKNDIPGATVRPGDTLSIHATKVHKKVFQGLADRLAKHVTPSWLLLDLTKLHGKVLAKPVGDELKQVFDPKLIVELYSR